MIALSIALLIVVPAGLLIELEISKWYGFTGSAALRSAYYAVVRSTNKEQMAIRVCQRMADPETFPE